MSANEWERLRAGFAVQGPYRRPRRALRLVLAIAAVLAVFIVRSL